MDVGDRASHFGHCHDGGDEAVRPCLVKDKKKGQICFLLRRSESSHRMDSLGTGNRLENKSVPFFAAYLCRRMYGSMPRLRMKINA
jgi:hypothetical protein